MTTNKDLSKPEHGTIQIQDVHDVKKELAADSTEKQNSFPPALITVQIIRTALELILVVLLLPLLSNPLVLILFSPFGLYFVLQAVAWSRAEKETRLAWVRGTNVYSLLIVAPLGAFYTLFVIETSVPNADVQPLWWMLGACVLEAIMSIFMIVTITVIKRKYPHAFQDKRVTVAKPRISDDVLEGSSSGTYETDGDLKPLKNYHEEPGAEVPRQHINVRLQKKD